jgi:hypothetical protein
LANKTAEEYVLNVNLLNEVASQLFSRNSRFSLRQLGFLDLAYATSHAFSQSLILGSALTDESIMRNNKDIIPHFVNTSEGSVYQLLQPDELLRADADLSFTKIIDGRGANMWVTARAPHSLTQREIVIEADFRRGDQTAGSALDDADFHEFETVAEQFYRDIIVDRMYRTIFADASVSAALN